MSNSSENGSQQLPLVAIVSLCLALLGAIAPRLAPLDSSRPEASSKAASKIWRGIEDVDSRLWQDPFKVAAEHDDEANTKAQGMADQDQNAAVPGMQNDSMRCGDRAMHHSMAALKGCIAEHSKNSAVMVLGVLVSGGQYPEDAEFRMRTRYAVLSGLANAGFYPKDSKHIGFFESPHDLSMLQARVPFEWFGHTMTHETAADAGMTEVLLLWLDETAFASEPLKTATKLIATLGDGHWAGDTNPKLSFRFLGPFSSDTLYAIAEELRPVMTQSVSSQTPVCTANPGSVPSLDCMPKLFVNAAASADPGILARKMRLHDQEALEKKLQMWLPIRTIATDIDLARSLTAELERRGLTFTCGNDPNSITCLKYTHKGHIALISEWDTFYGQEAFPMALSQVLKEKLCSDLPDPSACMKKSMGTIKLDEFSYMRGLDGGIPNESKPNASKANSVVANLNEASTAFVMERPEGQSQKDYLRRLGDKIVAYNQNLIDIGEQGFRAIGVVGSDTYDKLLILKALRTKFPGMLFFTTDLDARLMHPDELEFTRNLIIASSFGLELERSLQGKIPPFRDSYQTSYFLATQILLCHPHGPDLIKAICKAPQQKYLNESLGQPRIYELGLSRQPFDLSTTCNQQDDPSCMTVHPVPAKRHFLNSYWLVFLAIFGVVMLMGLLISTWLHDFWTSLQRFAATVFCRFTGRRDAEIQTFATLLLLLPALIGSFVLAFAAWCLGRDEPFAWVQGVSMWPTEFIRLIALFLGGIFLIRATRCLEKSKQKLSEAFYLDPGCGADDKNWPSQLFAPWRKAETVIERAMTQDRRLDVGKLWHWYCDGTSAKRMWPWITVATLMFFGLGLLLRFASGESYIPYRGTGMMWLDRLVLYPSIFVFLCLMMQSYFSTRFCAQFIKILANLPSHWPDKALDKYALRPQAGISADHGAYIGIAELRNKLIAQKDYYLDDLVDIHFISELTESTGKIVYYPFIILALMIFARSRIFDDWHLMPGLAMIFLLCAMLSVASIFYLRQAMQAAKEEVLGQLRSMVNSLNWHDSSAARKLQLQTQMAIAEISANRLGAFMPLTQEPALQALMLPLGGWGGQELLHYLVMMGI